MSKRWPGSLISPTAPVPSGGGAQDTALGIWTLDQANPYIANQTWPGTGVPDPQFQYVTALLHGDGTNAAQNNTFLDSSSNNFTITRNGNTTQGSFSPYGNLWSTFFNTSSGNYLTSSATNTSNFGSGNYTMELWLYTTSATTKQIFYDGRPTGSQSGTQVFFGISNSTGGTLFIGNSSGLSVNGATVLASNTWYHIAFVRSGTGTNQCAIYVNGVLDVNYTDAYTYTTANNTIGAVAYTPQGVNPVLGYMSNMRFGSTAVYTTAFTPSTAPLTAITGTKMLILQSNRFIDNSTNANTFSVTGTPSVQRFSPFQNLATYQTAKIGGSGYFDGSTSYLTLNSLGLPTGTNSFTIEFWYYAPVSYTAGSMMLFDSSTSSAAQIWVNAGNSPPVLRFGQSGVGAILDYNLSNLIPYQWTHFAYTRNGNTFTLYVNGTSVKTATNSVSFSAPATTYIGQNSGGGQYLNGYLSDFRVNNTVVYSGNFTPPTAPETAVSGTQLLLNYTNGAIYDNAEMNDLQTVGSAQISTSVVKYGTGSMYFPTSGTNYLTSQINPAVPLGSGNFTVEGWFYFTAVGTNNYEMISKETAGAANDGFRVVLNSSQKIVVNMSSNGTSYSLTITGATTIAANTWYHVAISKVGTNVTSYVNGNSDGSGTFSGSLYETNTFWALATRGGYGTTMQGYIDDFRVTAGYARYWFNFQPPSAPYPNYGGTLQLTYDPYFYNTTLLLNGDGTNGAQNNTFLDSSTNNFSITRNGNTTQGSFSPYGNLWSNYFNGSSNLSLSSNAAFQPGTGDFTIEAFVNFSANNSMIIAVYSSGVSFYVKSTGYLAVAQDAVAELLVASTPFPLNTWTHVALVRSGTTLTLYQNGSSVGSTSNSTNFTGSTVTVGSGNSVSQPANGYISNFRFVKGTAVYSGSTYTIPTTNLTAISGTSLLTCQSNRFIDNSSNAFTLTVNGTPQVQRFSPFNPTATYSTSVIGGSGYFDGSSYLTIANNSVLKPTGDFTAECSVYFTASPTGKVIMCFGDDTNTYSNITLDVNGSGYLRFFSANTTPSNDVVITTSVTPALNTWYYLCVTRSGNVYTYYVNGTSAGTTTVSTARYTGGTYNAIGCQYRSGAYQDNMTGYITDVRLVNGTAITPTGYPTAPETAVTNTQLLLSYQNAGIPDLAMQNDLQTVGSAQVSTAQYKYGSSSLSFPSSSTLNASIASSKTSGNLAGDFTIECWAYFNSVSITQGIAAFSDTGGWNGWQLASSSSLSVYFEFLNGSGAAAGAYSASGLIAVNTWYHIAVCRVGSAITIYLNGNPVASTTYSGYTTGSSSFVALGSDRTKTGNYFNGYIDDFRITNGISRYAQPFTPPTTALPTY
jgi:hypothetical protein